MIDKLRENLVAEIKDIDRRRTKSTIEHDIRMSQLQIQKDFLESQIREIDDYKDSLVEDTSKEKIRCCVCHADLTNVSGNVSFDSGARRIYCDNCIEKGW